MRNQKQNNPKVVMSRIRSFRANFIEGLDLIVRNAKMFIKNLFPPVLVAGLLCAVAFVLLRLSSGIWPLVEYGILLVLLLFLLAILRQAFLFMVSKKEDSSIELQKISWKKQLRPIIFEALPTFYLLVVQMAILLLLFWLGQTLLSVKSAVWLIPIIIIGIVLMIPFNLSLNLIQFQQVGFLKAILQGLQLSGRYFFSTLSLLFLSFIVLAIFAFILYLPIIILNVAFHASAVSVSFGDPTDLPSSLFTVHFLLSFILISVIFLTVLIWIVPQYFHHFSMLKKESERRKEQERFRKLYVQ